MRRSALALMLFSMVFLLTCQHDFGVDPIGQELHNYKVLFARNTTELNSPGGTGRGIYLVNADGSGLQDLSQHPISGYPGVVRGYDNNPQFSPDGSLIAFQSNRDGNYELYVMYTDGSNKKNITNESDLDLEFSWAPDGTRLVFTRLAQGNYILYVVGVKGSPLNPLTSPSDNCRYPAWSPKGDQIAFSRLFSGTTRWGVLVMNADGSNARSISDSTESAVFPQWSKDGSRVYYMVTGSGMRVKNVDGSFKNSLPGFSPYSTLSWSPDGQRFVQSDTTSIAVITADLASFSRLGIQGYDPRYSPDGRWILFLNQNALGVQELHLARVDGSDEHRLLESQFGDRYASWWPL